MGRGSVSRGAKQKGSFIPLSAVTGRVKKTSLIIYERPLSVTE